jgi:hypothetical protein
MNQQQPKSDWEKCWWSDRGRRSGILPSRSSCTYKPISRHEHFKHLHIKIDTTSVLDAKEGSQQKSVRSKPMSIIAQGVYVPCEYFLSALVVPVL